MRSIPLLYSFSRAFQLAALLLLLASGLTTEAAAQAVPAPNTADIKEIQYWLKRQGFYQGAVDGVASTALLQSISTVLKKPAVGAQEWVEAVKQITDYKVIVGIKRFTEAGEAERLKVQDNFGASFLGNRSLRVAMLAQSGFTPFLQATDAIQQNVLQFLLMGSVALPLRLTHQEQILALYNPIFDVAILTRWSPDSSPGSIDGALIISGERLRGEPLITWAPRWRLDLDGYLSSVSSATVDTIVAARKLLTETDLWEFLQGRAANKDDATVTVLRVSKMLQSQDNRRLQCGASADLFAAQFPQSLANTAGSLKHTDTQILDRLIPLEPAGGSDDGGSLIRFFVPHRTAHIVIAVTAVANGRGCDLTVNAADLESPSPRSIEKLKKIADFKLPDVEPKAGPPEASPGAHQKRGRPPAQQTNHTAAPQPRARQTYTVRNSLNVRSSPKTNGALARTLPSGSIFTTLDGSDDPEWTAVAVNHQRVGFIKNSAIFANASTGGGAASPPEVKRNAAQPSANCEATWTPRVQQAEYNQARASKETMDLMKLGVLGFDLEPQERRCARFRVRLNAALTIQDALKSCPQVVSKALTAAGPSADREKLIQGGVRAAKCPD